MSINEAILNAIQENLPAVTANELQKYLKTALDNEENLKILKPKIERLESENHCLAAKVEIAGNLDKKEKELKAKELEQQLSIEKIKVLEAEKRADAIYRLAETVFQNRALTKYVNGNSNSYSPGVGNHAQTETVYEVSQKPTQGY